MGDLWGPAARQRAREQNAARKRTSFRTYLAQVVAKTGHGEPMKDMTGQVVGHLTVIEKGATLGAGARWRCRCGLCNSVTTELGTTLRRAVKRNVKGYACESCRQRKGVR